MTDTLDSLEARAPEERERELMAGLPQLIARAQQAPGWARILDGVNAAGVTSRAALAQLPSPTAHREAETAKAHRG